MMLRTILFVACFAGLQAAMVRQTRSACPDFTTKPDFDYLQYAGVWYEIQRIPVVFEDGMTCVRAIYEYIGPNQISVANTAVLNGNITAIYGSAIQPDPVNEPGHLIVSFPGRPDGDYYVLDTDYTTWTAVYDCVTVGAFKFEYAWLMARTNSLTPEQLAAAQDAYTRNGIDVGQFMNTYHGDDCVYYP